MSKPFNNPNLLTKDRLKRELESNGIKLPRGDQKKDVYVKLYEENVSPKSVGRRLGNREFSSDEDYEVESEQTKQIVPRSSRSVRKVGSKEIISAEIKSMTNEELKEELSDLGQAVGPILPSTRALYEQKLARLQASSPNNAGTIVTVTKSEFSDDDDFDEGHEPEEESIPNDEFFYRGHNQRNDNFGSNFSKNFEKSSTKKEVMRDFSVSSSRNVERSSTFDRKTINKVRSKNGDKFEEKSWSSSGDNEKDEEDAVDTNRLPASIQKALSAARRLTPEKENGAEIRARPSRKPKPEQVPEDVQEKTMEEDTEKKQTKTSSRKWWILLVVLIVLTIAVAYNFEHLPKMQQFNALLENSTASSDRQ